MIRKLQRHCNNCKLPASKMRQYFNISSRNIKIYSFTYLIWGGSQQMLILTPANKANSVGPIWIKSGPQLGLTE